MKTLKIKSENSLYETAELFKNFSDSTRIRILYALLEGEKSVSQIVDEISMGQSAVSHQLRILKSSKLVSNRKEGKTVYYKLSDKHVYNILLQGIEHTEE
ncbi:MAG: metalloregulator ArsR/SmtB family transcription factor [Erysipelotrichaceae bacterium]|nr:metalloregulator ArsR/SmtB family transcription factor [Erysipelotrichaceae bacterium]